ncbi:DUF6913 domain-containing protein [Winogradskyella ursingii]|uniref:DUF6913 domain-containing protein n=1 Tax=Winogradskyella ursingii TaxID=2686079 RepID=UPI0015C6A103|nr:hypothetical protein [Winogradskyella ursingii]
MILKAFKEKSNQKYINKLLSGRSTSVNNGKVKTIAVLLNAEEFENFETFKVFFKELGLNSPKHKILAYSVEDNQDRSKWDAYCGPKDFGWKGKINHIDLQTFIDEEYDVLISYYKKDVLHLNLITALSKANFKVGISMEDERMYDLIIDVEPKEIEIFKTEFKKYLNILNKI